jgi:hypothetical protein
VVDRNPLGVRGRGPKAPKTHDGGEQGEEQLMRSGAHRDVGRPVQEPGRKVYENTR